MSLQINELLKPRYKVIADYPENTFDVGQILIESNIFEDWLQTDNSLHGIKLSAAILYPAIFEPLPWYAEREAGMMPEYVSGGSGIVVKVSKWVDENRRFYSISNEQFLTKWFLPSTTAEYEQYISKS